MQAQTLVLAMRMLQLHLTARPWQQSYHQLYVFCWQGLLGGVALRVIPHMMSSSARGSQEPAYGKVASLTAWNANCLLGVSLPHMLSSCVAHQPALQGAAGDSSRHCADETAVRLLSYQASVCAAALLSPKGGPPTASVSFSNC